MATEWHPSTKNPDNVCRYIKGIGLVTVFPCSDGTFKFAHGGTFSKPYPTQKDAQLAAKDCEVSAPAQRASAQERNTMATEATAAPQYATKKQFDKLVAYVQELVKDHNALEQRAIELERREEARRNHENQQPGVGRNKTNPKFQGRDAALEAEAS
jgi:hypothetical protein